MISLTVAGVAYPYPQTGDTNWGTGATAWAQAVTASMLSISGGTYALTADLNFGTNFGLVSAYYKSASSNISGTGLLRLASTDTISWRNNDNSADLALAKNSSDALSWAGSVFLSSAGIVPLAAGGTNANLTAAAGAVLYSTGSALALLAAGTSGQVLTSGGTSAPTWTSSLTNPMSGVGDLIYGGVSGAATRLAGDTSNTRKFLRELSSGGTPAAPTWDVIQVGDVPTLNQSTTGNAATATNATNATNVTGTNTVANSSLAQMAATTIKGNNTAGLANAADLTVAQVSAMLFPPGMMAPYAGATAPSGWLSCTGVAVSRTTYAALFAAISTTYGSGDGSTTFNLPNTQGVTIYGAGSQTIGGNTYSSTQGTTSADQMQGHTHTDSGHTHLLPITTAAASVGSTVGLQSGGLAQGDPWIATYGSNGTSSTGTAVLGNAATYSTDGTPRTGTQTIAANIVALYIIKT